jgi:extradiol dioxygenase family protein
MRSEVDVFHLAIPSKDLDESLAFYVDGLDCRMARRYEDRITLDFFGDQIVCHLAPAQIDEEPELYPRHFGVTFRAKQDFEQVLARAQRRKLVFFKKPFERFPGMPERHIAFFLCDPSNNLIEFKHYDSPEFMY